MKNLPKPLLERLVEKRQNHSMPSQVRPLACAFADQVIAVLYPHYSTVNACSPQAVAEDVIEVRENLARLLRGVLPLYPTVPESLPQDFIDRLFDIHVLLDEDAQAIFEGDPAAKNVDEVILAYPGFYAIVLHRIAHALHGLGLPLVPRLLSEHAHERTGIDLHPGARIGRRFCIDHGTGVVVGETTVIGENVKLYQGVTLGALTVLKEHADRKRHPTLENDVVVYAGATILGGETVVGEGSLIAGNAFLTRSVPARSVVGRNGAVRSRGSSPETDLDFVI